MSTPENEKLPKKGGEKLAIEPLKENEQGQIEGGFSELSSPVEDDQESSFNGIACKETNKSACG